MDKSKSNTVEMNEIEVKNIGIFIENMFKVGIDLLAKEDKTLEEQRVLQVLDELEESYME